MSRSLWFIVFLAACSAPSSNNNDNDAGQVDAGEGYVSARPPDAGAVKPTDGTSDVTLAISKLYLGDTDPDGTPDLDNGWESFGFDLDARSSTATSTGLCRPAQAAAPKTVYPDGNNGIDNAFGKHVVTIFSSLSSTGTTSVTASIGAGNWTYLLSLHNLGPDPDYNPILTRGYAGAMLDGGAKFDGSDVWPVTAESLAGAPDVSTANVQFSGSYLVGNTWVSGAPIDTLPLSLQIGNDRLPLQIHGAVISMQLSADHRSASHGVISGVLRTSELTDAFRTIAGRVDNSLCSGPTIDSITTQFEQASDIMADGTQSAELTCDGISIGLGFDAQFVTLGPAADAATPPTDPCP